MEEAIASATTTVCAAYFMRNRTPQSGLPDLVRSVALAFERVANEPEEVVAPAPPQKPAVPIKRSVTDDYIICLEDGKRFKMLKRYLRRKYDLTPEQYRRKWGLSCDYPMTAPAHAKKRSEIAKDTGLGRSGHQRRGHQQRRGCLSQK